MSIRNAGLDIRKIVKGAAEAALQEYYKGNGLDYAIARQLFYPHSVP